MIIERDQALFRGDHYNFPKEIWSVADQVWKPYLGNIPKPDLWGNVISDNEAIGYMAII